MCARSCLADIRWPMLLRNSQTLPRTMGITLSGVAVVRMQGNRGYTVTEDRISTHESKHKQPLPNTVRKFLKIAGVLGTGSRHLAKSGGIHLQTMPEAGQTTPKTKTLCGGRPPFHPKKLIILWRYRLRQNHVGTPTLLHDPKGKLVSYSHAGLLASTEGSIPVS